MDAVKKSNLTALVEIRPFHFNKTRTISGMFSLVADPRPYLAVKYATVDCTSRLSKYVFDNVAALLPSYLWLTFHEPDITRLVSYTLPSAVRHGFNSISVPSVRRGAERKKRKLLHIHYSFYYSTRPERQNYSKPAGHLYAAAQAVSA